MQETFRAIIKEMGGQPLSPMPSREEGYGIENGGRIIHEVGVTRMGKDPKTSVLNSNCQAHDVRNLFVADGGPFVSNPDKNCTWTILALSMRTQRVHRAGGEEADAVMVVSATVDLALRLPNPRLGESGLG